MDMKPLLTGLIRSWQGSLSILALVMHGGFQIVNVVQKLS